MLTGERSLMGSYGSFEYSVGLMARLLVWPSTKVYPSAGDLAAASRPRLPPEPGLLSMTTVQPVFVASFCATSRPMMSVPPPAGNGTINLMGLAGQACARTAVEEKAAARARPSAARRETCMVVSFGWMARSLASSMERTLGDRSTAYNGVALCT